RIHPDDRERITQSVIELLEGQDVRWDAEYRLLLADGTYADVFDRAFIARDQTGKATRVLGAMSDMTLRRRAEKQLAELQDRFESAVLGASEGLWDYNPATAEVWYSDSFKQLVGLTPDQYDSFKPHLDSFLELIHPDDKEPTMSAVNSHVERNTTYDVEYRLRMPSGEYHWFRARGRSVRDASGRALRMSGSITSIQDQRVAESRHDLAIRAAGVGLWDWNVSTDEAFFNDTYWTMLGYAPGELDMHFKTWQTLVHPDDLPRALNSVRSHFADQSVPYSIEHRLKKKDGTWLWIRAMGEVVERTANGEPRRMIGVHIDIDEQVRARLELEALSKQLHRQTEIAQDLAARAEAANIAKSEFLANMSHEIRTPMTAILGYAELLSDEGHAVTPVTTVDAIRTIRRNGEHLLSIINDILDLSKIEVGKLAIETTSCSPAGILWEVESSMRVRADEKGISLVVDADGLLPETIQSDELRIRQILINLVSNAIKFTDSGTVRLAARLASTEKETIEFDVIDTGLGMSEDQVARLFQPFTQADTSMARRFGGTGLGLAISRRLTDLLGGTLEIVATSPGQGTTMRVSIKTGSLEAVRSVDLRQYRPPSPKTEESASRGSPSTAVTPLEGVRVLLVEDNPENQRLISLILEDEGIELSCVDNGEKALATIEQAADDSPFACIIMDMHMPVMDGHTAVKILRDRGNTTPVIALTGQATEDERSKCLEVGCSVYLSKPFESRALLDAIRTSV
ncbi:MAG: PAS domain-containing protein, partial [Phycisphaerae bacterium]